MISLGIDQNNGTIFLSYDMHDNALKLMQSSTGAANSATWSNASACALRQPDEQHRWRQPVERDLSHVRFNPLGQ